MIRLIQNIKCFFGFHIVRVRQIALKDRYAEPQYYCIGCGKKIKKDLK